MWSTREVPYAVTALLKRVREEGKTVPSLVEVKREPPFPVVLLEWVEWLTEQCSAAPGGSSRLVLMGHNIKV